MKIILATGIYPPEIGGIATYAHALSAELKEKGHEVTVITYGQMNNEQLIMNNSGAITVSKSGGVLTRWKNYAKALQQYGADADVVIALSSVSTGIPLRMANLKKPKKILRLGGDFFWERYTDTRMKSLKEWYRSDFGFWKFINTIFMGYILRSFDSLVYSTAMQIELHQKYYRSLPPSCVLENAVPKNAPVLHTLHDPMRLLCMSRFVGFKNIFSLLDAVKTLQNVQLTIVGSGPMRKALRAHAERLELNVTWRLPTSEKKEIFEAHDLLIIPSITEISPNTALEARSHGLPVLLTEETGLSKSLTQGMMIRPLRTAVEIARAIEEVRGSYDQIAKDAAEPQVSRSWSSVADEWISLLVA